VKLSFKHLAAALAVVVATAAAAPAAMAQDYPDHPVKIIVPFAAGGGTDIFSRVVADVLGKANGQRFLV
jgi:tripartite-type tricarboxylate transporter receptor subunit TctC